MFIYDAAQEKAGCWSSPPALCVVKPAEIPRGRWSKVAELLAIGSSGTEWRTGVWDSVSTLGGKAQNWRSEGT